MPPMQHAAPGRQHVYSGARRGEAARTLHGTHLGPPPGLPVMGMGIERLSCPSDWPPLGRTRAQVPLPGLQQLRVVRARQQPARVRGGRRAAAGHQRAERGRHLKVLQVRMRYTCTTAAAVNQRRALASCTYLQGSAAVPLCLCAARHTCKSGIGGKPLIRRGPLTVRVAGLKAWAKACGGS